MRPGRQVSLYFPERILDEIRHEARRLQKSTSWVARRPWKSARADIGRLRPRQGGTDAADYER